MQSNFLGSSASAIVLGIFFGVSVVINIILLILVIVQRRNVQKNDSQPGEENEDTGGLSFALHTLYYYTFLLVTDRARIHSDMTNNDIYGDNGSNVGKLDKLPQEPIYYVYENIASSTPLINQGAYDYIDS